MAPWHDYQEQAAAFFRSLGLTANTNEHLEGVRGSHDVDVVVRQATAGIKQLWIVECKKWKRSVTQLHVSALAEIAKDVGADRGILLSESGFQAGAIRIARTSNITLSSISDLEENSEDEKVELGLYERRKRIAKLKDRISALTTYEHFSRGDGFITSISCAVPGADMEKIQHIGGLTVNIDFTLSAAEVGQWPVISRAVREPGRQVNIAHNGKQMLAQLDVLFSDLESHLRKQESSASAAR